ncbi:MAG: CRISPR-associated endonuclease Cas1 [Acidimicrobiales bacterium]
MTDRLAAVEETFAQPTAGGICVVDGYGCSVRVEQGALEVRDGIASHRRTRRFEKATHQLSRLVISNVTGTLTFDALRWLDALDVGVIVLGPDDELLLTSAPRHRDDARLRRIQAQASDLPVGLDLARGLIADKLLGEARVNSTRFADEETASTILGLADTLGSVGSIDEIRQIEATAAALYWGSWVGRLAAVPRFATRDARRIPSHWLRYDGRRSVLASANGNRKAERPVNAICNYLFALVEAECVLACHVVGLDPGLGLIHQDARGRHSLALDLMEPVRPEVESFVLNLLANRTFRKSDFAERADGHVRLMPPVTHELAETLPRWAELVAPVAERMAHALGAIMAGKYVATTPLTTRRHRQAQAAVKARKTVARSTAKATTERQRPSGRNDAPMWSCPDCGGPITNSQHVRCEACIAADPRQAPAIRKRRAEAIASRKRALRERGAAGLPEHCDRDWYRWEILPRLAGVKLAQIMEAAGCSKGFASVIRSGKSTPHVSTWPALAKLVDVPITGSAAIPHERQSMIARVDKRGAGVRQ